MDARRNRRRFLKQGAAIASLSATGLPQPLTAKQFGQAADWVKDAGMKMCLAYFWGVEPQKVALARQMGVLGAVGKSSARMVNLKQNSDCDYNVIKAVKKVWESEGLTLRVIEGPPALGEKTKLGLPGKDEEIEQFITFLKHISQLGIDTVCYNWMPVISWARTTLDRSSRGGALVSAFDIEDIEKEEIITEYGKLSHDDMWYNLTYFLKAVVPEAEKYGVKLAMHPDDPPIDSVQGIPRIMTSVSAFKRLIELVPSTSNGLTFCQGSFASMGGEGEAEDIPRAIEYFGRKETIHFVHFRDVRGNKNHFEETFHDDGKTDMYRAMEAYYRIGFRGPIRPDHVPTMAGDSNDHPGYSTIGSLFAIGYMRGLMEGVVKR